MKGEWKFFIPEKLSSRGVDIRVMSMPASSSVTVNLPREMDGAKDPASSIHTIYFRLVLVWFTSLISQ